MFSVAPLHPLHNGILELVARYPEMTVAQLHERLRTKLNIKTSLQHVYRVATQMTKEQVLVRVHGKISLNLMWVSYLGFYAERAQLSAREAQAVKMEFPLNPGERRKYAVSSLLEAETVWNHVLVQLYRTVGGKELLKYYSHAWWLLGKHARDIAFYQELANRGIRCRWVLGNDTPLDRFGAERLKSVFTAVISKKPPFPTEGYNVNVFGEYVLECLFPEKLQNDLAVFFREAQTAEDFDEERFADLFSRPIRCTVTLWRNAALAEELRNKIAPLTA